MRELWRTILQTLLWTMIVLLAFLVGSGLWQHFVAKDSHTGFFGIGYAVVVSGSMVPALNVDDMIFYHAHPLDEYEVGDVIVYEAERAEGEILITHRIVRFEGANVVTLGDANHGREDEPFPVERIVGKVVFKIPGAGKLVSFLKTPKGLLISGGIVIVLALVSFLFCRPKWNRKKIRTVSGEERIKG